MTDTPTDKVVEIRVHGVSNTPPHSMLLSRRPEDVELVAGDETTGFYRRTDIIPGANAQVLTLAYSWGQLTAGVRARKDLYRALWMLLLPFALVNVAFWARTRLPGVDRDDGLSRTGGLASWLARLLALSLTVTLVLAAAGVGVDMAAWQWPHAAREQPEEVRTLPWLEFLTSDWWASGSRALAVGLVAPAAALALLYGVARRTFAYEAEVPATATRPSARTGMPLTSPAFWRGERQVRNLAAIHLLVGATAACAVAAGPAIAADYGTGDRGRAAAWVLGVVLVVEALAALTLLAAPAVTDRGEPSTSAVDGHPRRSARSAGQRLLTAMPWAALATFAVTAAYLLLPRNELAPAATELPGFDATVRAMFIGQVLTLSALAAATRWSRAAAWTWTLLLAVLLSAAVLVVTAGPTRIDAHVSVFALTAVALVLIPAASWLLPKTVPTSLTASVEGREVTVNGVEGHSMLDQPAWRGTGTALLSGAGLLLGGLYAAGALFYVGRWLSTPSEGRPRLINPPDALGWAAVGLPMFVLVTAGFAIGAFAWLHRRASQLSSGIPAEYKRVKSVHAHVRARDVARARAVHEFVSERLLALIGWLGGLAIVGVALTCAGAATGLAPDENVSPDWLGQSLAAMRDFGTRLALLLAGAILLAGALVYRGRPERRGVGIVWDLATFWPRAGHPFAPPSYAERCVPQLMTRVGAGDASGYILAGHSQGAVLSLATVLQVPRELRAKLYLLTFGTQLHRLYGRVFPAVLGPVQLHQAATMLRVDADGQLQPWLRWQSLHRASDPLGYPVNVRLDAVAGHGAAAVDFEVVTDPTDLVPSGGEILDPPLRKHSDYPADVRYTALRDEAAARLCPTPPDSPDGCHADPDPR